MADKEALRADHRFMRDVIAASFSKSGVTPTPEDLDLVSRVFHKAGGTWERVFRGSVRDVGLLKKTIKAAVDGGHLTRTSNWGA